MPCAVCALCGSFSSLSSELVLRDGFKWRRAGGPAGCLLWVRPQCMLDFCVLYYPVSLALVPRLGSKGGRAGALPGVGWGDVPARAARAVTKEVP